MDVPGFCICQMHAGFLACCEGQKYSVVKQQMPRSVHAFLQKNAQRIRATSPGSKPKLYGSRYPLFEPSLRQFANARISASSR